MGISTRKTDALEKSSKPNYRYIDDDLEYSVLIPSREEWASIFNDQHYGPLHLWMRCVGNVIRAYFVIETLSDGPHLDLSQTAERERMYAHNLTLLANGVPIKKVITGGGGEFFLTVNSTNRNFLTSTDEVHISVEGWKHFAKFPIWRCSLPKDKSTGPAEYIMSTYTNDESSTISNTIPKMVTAIERHLLFHKCALNISSYEIPVELDHIPYFMANDLLAQFASTGFITFLIKGNHPGQYLGYNIKWYFLYQNLVILTHWRTGNKRIFFWDPDEYLHLPTHMISAFNEKLNTHSVVNFQRKTTICVDCDHNLPELGNSFANHTYVVSNNHLPGKIVINPDEAGCMLVHFASCSRSTVRLDSRIAYIAHFENLMVNRVSKNNADYKFHNYDVSLLGRCEKSDVVHSLEAASLQYASIMVESDQPYRDAAIKHYLQYEILFWVTCAVATLFLLYRTCKLCRLTRK